jgi:copper resistance protein B
VSGHRTTILLAVVLAASLSVSAQAQMDHGPPPTGNAAAAPFGVPPVADQHVYYHALFDELEGRFGNDQSFRWEGEAWLGTDLNRVWFKSEGTLTNGILDDGQQQLFFSRAVSTFFDAQVGARYDLDSGPGRGWVALGFEGLAPLFFHVATTGYVSGDGHLAARLEGSYDLLLTQRLVLQPQLEMNFYSQDDPMREIGAGLSDIDAGLRLRYEITRKIAPYIGVSYEGKFGGTADFARAAGAPTSEVRFLVGLRTWL